jgi:hypothetical protein
LQDVFTLFRWELYSFYKRNKGWTILKTDKKMKLQNLKLISQEYSISVFTLRNFIKMGLPHYRLGRKILVNPEEFEDWFERFKVNKTFERDGLNKFVDDVIAKMS